MTCAYYPIDYDPETGEVLFLVDEHPKSGGVIDCGESWGNLAWYGPNFSNWPEYCPDCTSGFDSYAAIQDRPLRRGIPASSSLASVLPERIPARNGKVIKPREGITRATHHDIQLQRPGGGVASVRLFEGLANPSRAGGERGIARQIRVGFETDRTPDDDVRSFKVEPVSGRQYTVVVNYHGKQFPVVLAKSRQSSELAVRR